MTGGKTKMWSYPEGAETSLEFLVQVALVAAVALVRAGGALAAFLRRWESDLDLKPANSVKARECPTQEDVKLTVDSRSSA
jgi:hypothetical protein